MLLRSWCSLFVAFHAHVRTTRSFIRFFFSPHTPKVHRFQLRMKYNGIIHLSIPAQLCLSFYYRSFFSYIYSRIVPSPSRHFSSQHIPSHIRMVIGFSWFCFCLRCVSRHSCCITFMAFGLVSVALLFVTLLTFPSFSFGGIRSWICGTCTQCQLCPPCEPHLNISPNCECHENLNNCNCNCVTHQNLHEYQTKWHLQLLANQHQGHAAQLNSNQFKRQLLFWLVGLSLFNLFLIIVVVLLIIFAPVLVQRCAAWRSVYIATTSTFYAKA